jgi:hypothetical protein
VFLQYHIRVRCPAQRSILPTLAAAFALFALLTVLTPRAAAQRGGHGFGQSTHRSGFRQSSRYISPYTSLPFPFLGDFFNLDDLYSAGYPVASQPPVILVQAARALPDSSDHPAQPKAEPATKTQPLMIERQNGRYVRVGSTPTGGELLAVSSNNEPARAPLLPALLVFRDGHSEEVRDYAIADGFLYARGDYYSDGYWNKKIALSTINLPQTFQANTARNVNFVLPTSPNEVITRP